MPTIRIPEEHWGEVWRALVASGPISRLSEEPEYAISQDQLELLRENDLPFEIVAEENERPVEQHHG